MSFRVIPVIDIRRGAAVHAVGGRREDYRPLFTDLSAAADPLEVAVGLRDRFGFDELYVADLDGITDGEANLPLLSQLCGISGLSVIVDAGVNNVPKAEGLLKTGAAEVIVGSETLSRLESVAEIVDAVGGKRVAGSIDLREGRVVSACPKMSGLKPAEAAKLFEYGGVGELILLDLSRVGSETGVDTRCVSEAVEAVGVPIVVGGGVTSIRDVLSLKEAGTSGVLVATALHRGRLSREELDSVRG